MNSLGARLRLLRKQRDLSQGEVANQLGYSRVQISNWEIERSEPDVTALRKLASFYMVTLDDLSGNVDSHTNSLSPEKKQSPKDISEESIGERVSTFALSRSDKQDEDLPEEAQKQIDDFRAYIRQKYKKPE